MRLTRPAPWPFEPKKLEDDQLTELRVTWEGPFRFIGEKNTVFKQLSAEKPGLYIWGVTTDKGFLANYVGITTGPLSNRLRSHLTGYFSGKYWLYDADFLKNGQRKSVYEPTGDVLPFANDYERHSKEIFKLLNTFELMIAPFPGDVDVRDLQRIESGIIKKIREHEQERKDGPFLDNERLSATTGEGEPKSVKFEFSRRIIGLPDEFKIGQ